MPAPGVGLDPRQHVLAVAHDRGYRARHHPEDSDAIAILKARFARGDISRSEYEEQRRILQM